MAIDTAAKRAAALGVGQPPGVILPIPDGTIDAYDRAALTGVYMPDSASGAPAFVGPSIENMTLLQNAAMIPRDFSSRFTGAALTFSVVGTLPAGLSLSSVGVLSGTPTALGTTAGLIIRATDGATADSNAFSITVSATLPAPPSAGRFLVNVGRLMSR